MSYFIILLIFHSGFFHHILIITHSTLSHSTAQFFLDQAMKISQILLSSGRTNQNLSLSLNFQIIITSSTFGNISKTIASSFQL